MLDIFSCSNNLFKQVRTCHTIKDGIKSDHTAVIIKIELTSIAFKMHPQNHPGQETTDWDLIITDDQTNIEYNQILTQHTQPTATNPEPQEYTEFFKCVKEAGQTIATKTKLDPSDWFELNKSKIQPTIDAVTTLLKQKKGMRQQTNPNQPITATQTSKQNQKHHNCRSEEQISIKICRRDRRTVRNELQKLVESSKTMQTWKQEQSQEAESHVTQTPKWTTSKNRQGEHERLPTTLHTYFQQQPHRIPQST
jgi:hypothetical protein